MVGLFRFNSLGVNNSMMTMARFITPVENISRREDPDVQVRSQNLVELKSEKTVFPVLKP